MYRTCEHAKKVNVATGKLPWFVNWLVGWKVVNHVEG